MKLEGKYIDELIDIRNEARQKENWKLSDRIRNFLDTKHVFVFDNPEGQLVYHRLKGTRQDLINELKREQRAQSMFDAWLYSMNKSNKRQNTLQNVAI